eukprot:CAMPEP_0172297232 /NCGR_PEP_ID=MMETSP1058-20130122/335_1 /TAXON_ID=83371 /ORGANISM="Detonula confervacea, Strain CCMP 353" /LENGTH=912 /DNA_ID=CAMNT_0013006357 /DNA_START=96 /DNA_END=2834 /DNA_ORIENTATION=+
MKRRSVHRLQTRDRLRQGIRHQYHDSRGFSTTAIIVFSCCFLLCAHHPVPLANGFLCANTISPRSTTIRCDAPTSLSHSLRASTTVEDGYNDNDGDEQLGQGQQQLLPSYYRSTQLDNQKYQQSSHSEEDQVHEWLLQSTSLILGNELTLKLVNGDNNVDTEINSSPDKNNGSIIISDQYLEQNYDLKRPPHFATDVEYILQADSVMRAWCQWIVRCSNGGFSRSSSVDGSGEGVIRCSAMNAARIIDAILYPALRVMDERRAREGINKGGGMRVVNWETKLIEMVNVAIDAWAASLNNRSKNESASCMLRAEGWFRFLQRRLSLQEEEEGNNGLSSPEGILDPCLGDYVLKLYEESHRMVIKAFIRSHERKYLKRAILLLEGMRAEQNTSLAGTEARVYPTTQTYNLVLYGLANCEPCVENAERAETILQEMIACQQSGEKCVCGPDSNTFRQVIIAWTKSGSNRAAENACRLLDQMLSDFPMLDPDASTFNALMTIYLKLGKTEETLTLFDLITALHRSGRSDTQPDIYSVNLMLKAMTKQPPYRSLGEMEAVEELLEDIQERLHVQPDVQSYNIVIDAWAKSRLDDAATRAELLLDCMEKKCWHDRSVAPDGYSFTSTINAIERSHHQERGPWAERVFHRMKELHSEGLVEEPTTPVYNSLLNCLISCGSLERAEALFSEMESAGLANTRTFNTMLKGYSMFRRSGGDGGMVFSQPKKAEKLLDEMELSYYSKEVASVIPDKYSYTTVISAYGRSNVKRKAAKASMILRRMLDSYTEGNSAAKPGTYAFNAVLNACAHTRLPEEHLEGFSILCSTLILLREWTKPDHTTYGRFLQACARLLPRDETRKWRVVETVFNSCVKEGQCGELVLRNLKNAASPELYYDLVGDGEIPSHWRRNVAGRKDSPASN